MGRVCTLMALWKEGDGGRGGCIFRGYVTTGAFQSDLARQLTTPAKGNSVVVLSQRVRACGWLAG